MNEISPLNPRPNSGQDKWDAFFNGTSTTESEPRVQSETAPPLSLNGKVLTAKDYAKIAKQEGRINQNLLDIVYEEAEAEYSQHMAQAALKGVMPEDAAAYGAAAQEVTPPSAESH
jgi:hypothetical protein